MVILDLLKRSDAYVQHSNFFKSILIFYRCLDKDSLILKKLLFKYWNFLFDILSIPILHITIKTFNFKFKNNLRILTDIKVNNRDSSFTSMTNRQRIRYAILILSFLGLFIVLSAYPNGFSFGSNIGSGSKTSNNVDSIVLDSSNGFGGIPLEDVNGNIVYTDDFKGKLVLMEMMATWCMSCAQQEQILKELYPNYEDKNFILLSVSVDPTFDTRDVLKNHIVKKGIPWLMTRDTTLMMTDFFKVTELATVLIISPEGEVVERFVGVTDLDTLSKSLDQLL